MTAKKKSVRLGRFACRLHRTAATRNEYGRLKGEKFSQSCGNCLCNFQASLPRVML